MSINNNNTHYRYVRRKNDGTFFFFFFFPDEESCLLSRLIFFSSEAHVLTRIPYKFDRATKISFLRFSRWASFRESFIPVPNPMKFNHVGVRVLLPTSLEEPYVERTSRRANSVHRCTLRTYVVVESTCITCYM